MVCMYRSRCFVQLCHVRLGADLRPSTPDIDSKAVRSKLYLYIHNHARLLASPLYSNCQYAAARAAPRLDGKGSVLTYTGLEEGKRGEVRICRHTNLNCVWCVSFATHQTLWMQNYLCIDSDGCRMYYKCCGRYMQCIFILVQQDIPPYVMTLAFK